MKKIFGFMICVFFLFTSIGAAQTVEEDELIQLATVIEENNLAIENWEVMFKRKSSKKYTLSLLEQLKNSYLVTVTEDENKLKYVVNEKEKNNAFSVQYNVLITKQSNKSEIITVIKGSNWNRFIMEAYQSFVQTKNEMFTQTSQKYTCLETKDSGIIDVGLLLKNIKEQLNLSHIVTQTDTVEQSVHKNLLYGYTPLWDQKIWIDTKPMNVQIVEKAAGLNQSNLTIGTPILVNEY